MNRSPLNFLKPLGHKPYLKPRTTDSKDNDISMQFDVCSGSGMCLLRLLPNASLAIRDRGLPLGSPISFRIAEPPFTSVV
jgi:hypothetical protein